MKLSAKKEDLFKNFLRKQTQRRPREAEIGLCTSLGVVDYNWVTGKEMVQFKKIPPLTKFKYTCPVSCTRTMKSVNWSADGEF